MNTTIFYRNSIDFVQITHSTTLENNKQIPKSTEHFKTFMNSTILAENAEKSISQTTSKQIRKKTIEKKMKSVNLFFYLKYFNRYVIVYIWKGFSMREKKTEIVHSI